MGIKALRGGEKGIETRVSTLGALLDMGRHRIAKGRYYPGSFTVTCKKEKTG